MGKIIRNNIEYSGSSNSAGNISYDNSASDLNSLTVQNAITELDGLVGEKTGQKEYVNNELKGEIFNTYSGNAKNVASGNNSHAEGNGTTASGNNSHAEGHKTTASGLSSHAEGFSNTASGNYSHVEGNSNTASGNYSHVEGFSNTASKMASHVEGGSNTASGAFSHAEGFSNTASGANSHAGGTNTMATAESSTVIGQYNVADGTEASDPKHLFIIGNGTANNARSNILEVSKTDMNVNGDIKQNGVPLRATTMPTITASMLGKVVQYVGTTDANYTQGWFYIASSDGAAEPTYSWAHLPTQNGYSETVLWEWQSSSDSHADAILSASFLDFDALMLISNAKAFLEGSFAENDGEGYTTTVSVSELVRHSGGTIVLGGSDVSGNSYAKYSFDTSSPTAITHESHGSGTWAQTLRTVIGIKY